MKYKDDVHFDSSNNIFFDNIDLNDDIKSIYEFVGDKKLLDALEEDSKLTKIRNNNHKKYYDINIQRLLSIPKNTDAYLISKEIIDLYNTIDASSILNCDLKDAIETFKTLYIIDKKFFRLEKVIEADLKILTSVNNEHQKAFSINYFNNLDVSPDVKAKIISKYNELVLYNANIPADIYEDLKIQTVRSNYIEDIIKLISKDEITKINNDKKEILSNLNKEIDAKILKLNVAIHYLEDLIKEKSKYNSEFNEFKSFIYKILAYDDTSYDNALQTYEILKDDKTIKEKIKYFENVFISELENSKEEEIFVYEKYGIKNIKISLDYILANYMDKLSTTDKESINYISTQVNSDNYDLKEIENLLGNIVKKIWFNSITDPYNFNPNNNYSFICSNTQFMDEKYETFLITKKMVQQLDDYLDFQIGFICNYDNNILYITQNEDIMSVDYDDMSKLKTPIEIEQEYLNFKAENKIVLNGYKTFIDAVYFINDGNMKKYLKAVELANVYKIPLIELKK